MDGLDITRNEQSIRPGRSAVDCTRNRIGTQRSCLEGLAALIQSLEQRYVQRDRFYL
jgi:hypothetical protein